MTLPGQRPQIDLGCGGTGGHLFPGLAIAAELSRYGCGIRLFVSAKEVDQRAVRNSVAMEVITLPAIGLRHGAGAGFAFLRAFIESYRISRKTFAVRPPHAVLAMGGFTSAPPLLAARRFGAATFLHESNSVPGRANRWLSWFVDRAFIGFPSVTPPLHTPHVTRTGTPVRPQFNVVRPAATCRTSLGLDPSRDVVLVMGGSQGASGINEIIRCALPLAAARVPSWQWLHLTGPNDVEAVGRAYRTANLHALVQPFSDAMELALGAATVAISRAGASSLAELAAVRLPAILVPYPSAADNHQFHNARAFEQTGAARLVPQQALTPEILVGLLQEIVLDTGLRQSMRQALAAWHMPRAAEQIAEAMLKAVTRQERADEASSGSRSDSWRCHSSAIA